LEREDYHFDFCQENVRGHLSGAETVTKTPDR
jgi:hypothetical protein